MTSAGIIAICAILFFISLRSSFWIFKVLCGISFIGLFVWWIANPIGDDASSPAQTIMLMLTFITGVSCWFWGFWTTKTSNGKETGKFRIPFVSPSEEEEERRRSRQPSRQERNSVYYQRVRGALRGGGRGRRY